MRNLLGKIGDKEHFALVLFFITASLMILVTVVVTVYINHMELTVEDSIQNHLAAAAQAASTLVSVEELDLFHTEEDMEKPEWNEIRARLQQFAKDYRVLYVYYWRYFDNQIQYIIDNDEDEEWMVTPAWIYSLEDDPETAKAVPHLMSGGTWVTDLGTYTATWDGLISGLAPVFNQDGTVHSAAGVDLSDEIIIIQRNNIRVMRTVLITSIAISVLSGFLGMWLYRKKAFQSDSANKAKSQFLSTMSHEIRTPMNAIIGIAQIELQKNGLTREQTIALEKIYNSGNNLLGTINDILDLSKIETGKLELSSMEYDVPRFINDTVQINIVRIGSKQIEFILDVDKALPVKIIGDDIRLKQILNNILSNAIKYTEKGHVKLSVKHSQDTVNPEYIMLCFTVEDTGQGLKPEDLAKLSSEYTRFNIEANRATEGTGIGMSITYKLVELMEGTIKAESEFGKGSIFTVTVKQTAVECEAIGQDISERLRTFTYSTEKHYANLDIQRETMPYGKVLIVDDVETNLFVAEGLLKPYELEIETAISGFGAIEKIVNGKTYDVIFMDHLMPLMDGVATTKKLREMQYEGTIVALTANALVGNEQLFKQNGFDDFISKPIDVELLDNVLNTYIRDKKPLEAEKYRGLTKDAQKTKLQMQTQRALINPKIIEAFCRDAAKAVISLRETLSDVQIHDLADDNFTVRNLKQYITTVHAMKSALGYIGEKEKSEAAAALEKAGQAGDTRFIAEHSGDFIRSLETLLEKFDRGMNATEPEKENIGQVGEDKEFLLKQLQLIKSACEDYDDSAAYALLDILKEKPLAVATSSALEEIREELFLHSDFDSAAEKTKKLMADIT